MRDRESETSQELEQEQEVQQDQAVEIDVTQTKEPAVEQNPDVLVAPETKTSAKGESRLKMGELKVTVGTAGARNIVLDKFWVQAGNNFPCGFNIKTLPGHTLEVTMQQVSY